MCVVWDVFGTVFMGSLIWVATFAQKHLCLLVFRIVALEGVFQDCYFLLLEVAFAWLPWLFWLTWNLSVLSIAVNLIQVILSFFDLIYAHLVFSISNPSQFSPANHYPFIRNSCLFPHLLLMFFSQRFRSFHWCLLRFLKSLRFFSWGTFSTTLHFPKSLFSNEWFSQWCWF